MLMLRDADKQGGNNMLMFPYTYVICGVFYLLLQVLSSVFFILKIWQILFYIHEFLDTNHLFYCARNFRQIPMGLSVGSKWSY